MKLNIFNRFLAWNQSDFKGAFPFTMTVSKIMDFKENDLFQENEQNEQILSNFKERVLYRSVCFFQILWILRKLTNFGDFHQITRF